MEFTYNTKGTCSSKISFSLEDDIVKNISFLGGCPGNTKALAKVLEGQRVSFILNTLLGNPCGMRGTSCADQLALCVKDAYEKSKK